MIDPRWFAPASDRDGAALVLAAGIMSKPPWYAPAADDGAPSALAARAP